ncbi:MAG: MAPEG family protein [Pseudomonadota bacterium]
MLGINTSSILLPLAGHLLLLVFLYAWLSALRAINVMRGASYSDLAQPKLETGLTYRVAANLKNQFEVPLLLYPLVLLLWSLGTADQLDRLLVWVFVWGRIIHTGVQTLTTNVPLRGVVFTVNFLAVMGLWAKFLIASI